MLARPLLTTASLILLSGREELRTKGTRAKDAKKRGGEARKQETKNAKKRKESKKEGKVERKT